MMKQITAREYLLLLAGVHGLSLVSFFVFVPVIQSPVITFLLHGTILIGYIWLWIRFLYHLVETQKPHWLAFTTVYWLSVAIGGLVVVNSPNPNLVFTIIYQLTNSPLFAPFELVFYNAIGSYIVLASLLFASSFQWFSSVRTYRQLNSSH